MVVQQQAQDESNGGRKASILPGNGGPGGPAGGPQSAVGGSSGSHAPLQNTVFIHKLYNILEDDDLKDLIWWSASGTSFLIRPTERFSRALATYFKHTNIASFVRQLNMYGFHKVSNDHSRGVQVQQAQQPSYEGGRDGVKIWEFRHSTGIFKRGDIEGLKFIKRRSSRNITTLNVRKNSNPSLANVAAPAHTEEPENAKQQAAPQQAAQQQQSLPQYHPQMQQWQRPQFIINTENEPQQATQPQVGLTSYPSSESMFNQQLQSQQLEAKLSELSQSFNGLRYDYFNLQFKHDELLEQLRVLNMDMVKLLEFLQSFVTLQKMSSEFYNEASLKDSPTKMHQFQKHQQDLAFLEQEMLRFKTNLTQRLQRNLEAVQQQHQHQQHQQQQKQQQQPPQQAPQSTQQFYSYAPNVFPRSSSVAKDTRSVSRSSVPTAAQAFAPHLFAVPAAPSGTNIPAPSTFAPQPDFAGQRMMLNPFESTGQTTSVKRNMSILLDPLSSAPVYPGPQSSSPSRHTTLGSQIPRNSSPLVNSHKAPKQESVSPVSETAPPIQPNTQQTQQNTQSVQVGQAGQSGSTDQQNAQQSTQQYSGAKRTTLKDGIFVLKPDKNNSLTANRNSISNDSGNGNITTPKESNLATGNEPSGSKDGPAIGLSFRTFYSNDSEGPLDEQSKGDPSPTKTVAQNAQDATNQSLGKIPIFKTSQPSLKQPEPLREDSEASPSREASQQAIISPVPSRTDIGSRRCSSGVYSLLNREASAPVSPIEEESNSAKRIKL